MFRKVELPGDVPGTLFLHSMPGRYEPLPEAWAQIRSEGIRLIVCLAERDEIWRKSPRYAEALEELSVPCDLDAYPIKDFEVPGSRKTFWNLAERIAVQLRAGSRVLIHCAAGIGRTGMLAACVLVALGKTQVEAEQAVESAGSCPERQAQKDLVAWCAMRRNPA